jgi:hypothetical protein
MIADMTGYELKRRTTRSGNDGWPLRSQGHGKMQSYMDRELQLTYETSGVSTPDFFSNRRVIVEDVDVVE